MPGSRFLAWARGSAAAALTLACATGAGAAERGRTVVDLAVGTSVPFSGELREDYGAAAGASLGLARKLPGDGAWVVIEAELWSNSGQDIPVDPTFEIPDASYVVAALNLGFRRNLVPPKKREGVDAYFGMGAQWAFSRWEGPYGDIEKTPTLGLYFEFRPEVEISRGWGIWMRGRGTFLLDTEYGGPGPEHNYSGPALQLGMSHYFGGSAS